jgi:hypothetical protein
MFEHLRNLPQIKEMLPVQIQTCCNAADREPSERNTSIGVAEDEIRPGRELMVKQVWRCWIDPNKDIRRLYIAIRMSGSQRRRLKHTRDRDSEENMDG